MVKSTQARHSSAAQPVSLEFTHGTCELSVWYKLFSQVLSIITRSRIVRHGYAAPCGEYPVCVAVRKQLERLRSRNGRTLCAPTEDEQYARSLIVSALQISPCPPRERGDSQEGGNRRCLLSCAPARRQRMSPPPRGAANLLPSADGKLFARKDRTACADRVPRKAGV